MKKKIEVRLLEFFSTLSICLFEEIGESYSHKIEEDNKEYFIIGSIMR